MDFLKLCNRVVISFWIFGCLSWNFFVYYQHYLFHLLYLVSMNCVFNLMVFFLNYNSSNHCSFAYFHWFSHTLDKNFEFQFQLLGFDFDLVSLKQNLKSLGLSFPNWHLLLAVCRRLMSFIIFVCQLTFHWKPD